MKKLFFTLAMMLVGSTAAWADDPYLTIDPFTITSATGNNFVKVRIHCDSDDTEEFDYLDINTYETSTLIGTRFTAFQCSIILPDGLLFKKLGSVYAVKSGEFTKAVEFSIGQNQFTNADNKEQLNLVVYSTQNAPLYPIVVGDEAETATNFLFQFAVVPKDESAYGKYEMEAVKIIIAPHADKDGNVSSEGSVKQDDFNTPGSYPLTLDEGKNIPTWNGSLNNVDVNMTRTIKAGYNTVCFPFAMTGEEVATTFGEGSQAYSYSESAGQVSFSKADGIEANVPVLLNATSAASKFALTDRTIVAPSDLAVPGNTYDYVGNYTPGFTIEAGNYVLSNGSIVKSLGGSTVNGMRAYFAKKGAEAKSLSMDIEGEATGIQFVNGEVETVGDIYTVGGQLVRRNSTVKGLPEGIYMINGNKVVVRK